jgi:chloramphenicol O-acetyltransferase
MRARDVWVDRQKPLFIPLQLNRNSNAQCNQLYVDVEVGGVEYSTSIEYDLFHRYSIRTPLGLKFGAASLHRVTKELVYNRVQEFTDRFKAQNGSLTCRDLLGCDISTPDGHQVAKEKSLFTTVCPKLVKDAVEVLGEMLAKRPAKPSENQA